MKVEISKDQNTLTVDGIEYEAKIDTNLCDDCFFWSNKSCNLGGMEFSKCAPKDRADAQSIFWIKKQVEQMTKAPALAPAPVLQHKHFDLIVAWAKNPTQSVWVWSSNAEWTKLILAPQWTGDFYAIGEKPTMPPVKMVKYENGTIEFPEPLKEPPPNGTPYFFALLNGTFDAVYHYDRSHHHDRLSIGTIHMTREGALKQCEALQELLKNQIKRW